ncbi:response regulator [Pandoraea sp. NPDC087047]|uniref:response regulator n=1 Tax=Pandoraea sp. NPDC087047 TaxID=3364390 RepID=UPI00380DE757
MKKLNIILADDHPAIISGLRTLAEQLPGVDVVGHARDSTSLVEMLRRLHCDVIVTDYAMPGGRFGDGLLLLEFLQRRYPDVVVIVYTAIDNPALLDAMHKRGARAVFSKIEPPEKVAAAIRAVAEGTPPSDSRAKSPTSTAKHSREPVASGFDTLTKLEAEVVRLYVSGLTIDEIAELRHRSKQTISAQKQSAKRKLNIARDIDLIHYVKESGFATLSGATTAPAPYPPDGV